jgi:hypothetical protein
MLIGHHSEEGGINPFPATRGSIRTRTDGFDLLGEMGRKVLYPCPEAIVLLIERREF